MNIEEIKNISLDQLIALGDFDCSCGKKHSPGVKRVSIGKNALSRLPEYLTELNSSKPFIISGHDSYGAAGDKVCTILRKSGFEYSKYVFPESPVKPTEHTVGSSIMHFDFTCDSIIGVGSGVINDTAKILAHTTGRRYIAVATAPSMDGFVSGTSSMDRDGLKVSLYSTAPWAVIGDLDILQAAPLHLLRAGIGDMLAKIISLREWELARIIVGEYFCPITAALVQRAVDRVLKYSSGLEKRDPETISAIMEGLLMAGIAMNYAGMSRPASGMEHYFSHIWDMRSLAFHDAKCEQHGIQAGLGTLYSLQAYESFLKYCKSPDKEKALNYVSSFSLDSWNERLLDFVGPGANAMIEGDRREKKYDLQKHSLRLKLIFDNWNEIVGIISSLPSSKEIRELMISLGLPCSAAVIGYSNSQVKTTFTMTKDIRDKYIGSRLFWDLGVLDEIADAAFAEN